MNVSVIMLAAGQSKRFGSAKQLAEINGKPLVAHCLEVFLQSNKSIEGINQVNLVLGCYQDEIRTCIPDSVNLLYVKNWAMGMGQSIAESLVGLNDEVSHVFIALADQIAINIDVVNKMLLTSKAHPSKIVAAKYRNNVGAPAIFPRVYVKELQKLTGDRGAKRIIQQNMENVMCVSTPEAELDIDTPQDLLSFLNNRIN